MTYQFDGFKLLRITTHVGTYFKVFGGRAGGYVDSDTWRLNSGVYSAMYDTNWWYFYGNSGSCYKVPRKGGFLTVYHNSVLSDILKHPDVHEIPLKDVRKVLKDAGIQVQKI